MDQVQLAKRQDRVANETLVIQRVEEGFRVYSADEPQQRYIVSGSPESPECTCPDSQYHRNDPEWLCKHVLAVLNECSDIEVVQQSADAHEAEERRAIEDESRGSGRPSLVSANGNGSRSATQLLLKRSVSPDGRIDSLSIELSTPVDAFVPTDVQNRAERMLRLQSGIVAQFFTEQRRTSANGQQRGNGAGNGTPQRFSETSPNGRPAQVQQAGSGMGSPAVPARLVNVAGMNGKWGRRLFINVETDGATLKLFGKAAELIEHIRSAGYVAPEPFVEGIVLDIPCTVTTKPSPDGRFTNVERVMPANQTQSVRRIGQ